jgi:hypothetical protein
LKEPGRWTTGIVNKNPYEAPVSDVDRGNGTSPTSRRPRSGSGLPLAVIALLAWVFPGGVMLTWFIAAISLCFVLGRGDRRSILPTIFGGIGLIGIVALGRD